MPSSVGPNIFGEENLVFGYDLGDVSNSYKGEPTVNLVTNPDFATGNYSGWSSTGVGGAVEITGVFSENGYNYFHKKVNKVTAGSLDRITQSSVYTINTSLQTTVTFDIWINPLNAYGITFYGLGSTADDTTYDEKPLSSNGTTVKTVSLGGGWNRYIYTLSTAWYTGTGNTFRVAVYPDYGGTGLLEYKLRRVQVEQKSHATPFVNGTRSATQGLIDLTGNSTIDLTNVSFDSNAQMTFDGTNDYITLSSTSHPTGSCSMEIVFNHTHNFVGSRYLLYGASGTAFWVFFRGDWAGNLLYFTRRVTNSGNYGDSAWGYTTGIYQPVPANETMHLIFTHDATSGEFKCYKNGILTRTVNGNLAAYGALNTTQQSHYIGGSPGDNLPMTLPLFKFYDRVLSSSEVALNYKAIKGRFNI